MTDRIESPDTLTVIEQTLIAVLATSAARRASEFARQHGWPQPDETQAREVGHFLARALTAIVVGMRRPAVLPPSDDELSAVLDGLALGAIEKVLGASPTPELVH